MDKNHQDTDLTKNLERHIDIPIRELDLRPIIILDKEDTALEAVKKMVTNDSTYVIVKLTEGLGIITERDILKKILYKEKDPAKIQLKDVATFPIIRLSQDGNLYEAILLMAKHGIRKLLIEKDNIPIGVLEERDIILHESKNAVTITKEINKAKSFEELKYLYKILKNFVIERILNGIDAIILASFISEINDRFMRRAAELTIEELSLNDIAPFSILVLGSEGRREQSLKTDQDNALIYDAADDDQLMLAKLEDFSKRYIEHLLDIGFPPCPEKVMINNPFWRRNLSNWKITVESWLRNPKPENTLKIAIFFDFRSVYGDQSLADEIFKTIQEITRRDKTFVRFLANDAINFKPSLGFFRDFVLEKSGEIDIKKGGILPIVLGIRALAMEEGITSQNTIERIEKLHEKNVLNKSYTKDLKEAYRFILALRFKYQAKKMLENKEPDNLIDPKDLSTTEKNALKDIFRFIKDFQEFLTSKYGILY